MPSQAHLFAVGRQAFEIEQDAIEKAFAVVDESAFLKAVEVISHSAANCSQRVWSFGIACQHFVPPHVLHPTSRAFSVAIGSIASVQADFWQAGDVILCLTRRENGKSCTNTDIAMKRKHSLSPLPKTRRRPLRKLPISFGERSHA